MFDTSLRDSQSTAVTAVEPGAFDRDAYAAYAAAQDKKVEAFLKKDSGVLVYRRFRVAEAFGAECRDKELSLRLQLGGLMQSMAYEADMANFLEPWYGIGIGAAAFGAQYVWLPGQAPAVTDCFPGVEEALEHESVPIEDTEIGAEQLRYIEYFMEQTGGVIPMSFGDIQSPLNIVSEMLPTDELFTDMYEDPEGYLELARRAGRRKRDFLLKEKELIGSALALPGHGFASSRSLYGLGTSADTSIMINNRMFDELEAGPLSEMCEPFGGVFYHSCGNWEAKLPSVLKVPGLVGADGAFSSETDPSPNDPAPFGEAFAHTGKILNLRAVGNADTVTDVVRRVWRPGLRLIVNTYCKTPEEQKIAYERIHEICQD